MSPTAPAPRRAAALLAIVVAVGLALASLPSGAAVQGSLTALEVEIDDVALGGNDHFGYAIANLGDWKA